MILNAGKTWINALAKASVTGSSRSPLASKGFRYIGWMVILGAGRGIRDFIGFLMPVLGGSKCGIVQIGAGCGTVLGRCGLL